MTRSVSCALTFITFFPHPRPKCNTSKLPSQRLCVEGGRGQHPELSLGE